MKWTEVFSCFRRVVLIVVNLVGPRFLSRVPQDTVLGLLIEQVAWILESKLIGVPEDVKEKAYKG